MAKKKQKGLGSHNGNKAPTSSAASATWTQQQQAQAQAKQQQLVLPFISPTIQTAKGPCLSSSSSSLETLIPDYVWYISNFFSASECQAWINFADPLMVELTAHKATRYIAHRECFRYSKDSDSTAKQIFERLQTTCPQALELLQQQQTATATATACNPNIRLYKYQKNMSFGKHVDESNLLPEGITRFTILIYLSSCQGGATRFELPPTTMTKNKRQKSSSIAFQPTQGSLLLHLHGDDCLTHEADPVAGGVKYVLRTDLVYAV